MKRYFLMLCILLSLKCRSNNPIDSLSSTSELEKITKKREGKYLKDLTIIPLPIVFRFPETGWAGGVLIGNTFRFKKDSDLAKPSQISLGAAYTQNKQVLLYLPFSVFYDENKYYFSGEIAWYRYNYQYFGIGENQVPNESYGVDYPRIKILASKMIGNNLYAGLRYQFEDYNITSTEPNGELASGKIAGSKYSRTSSLGISFLKDTRDSVFYPRKGVFGEFFILPTLKVFGADRNFNRIVMDVAHYQSFSKKIILASHFYGSFIQGKNIPFSQLSLLGGSKRFRGIFEGRYRDKNMLIIEAESRFEVWKWIGFTTFGSLAWLGNETDFIRFNKTKAAYGAGLRIKAVKKDHINIRIDYAIHPKEKGNFYFTVGEAF